MALPLLLAGLSIATGALGVGGHLSAKETNEKAQRKAQAAQELYNHEKYALEQAQNKTEEVLLKLGYEKKYILDTSMQQFLNLYDKIKHVQIKESVGINEISKFMIEQQGAIELKQMVDIYSSAILSGATGTAAGIVVALAVSGTSSVVTGGLATAGRLLLAGNVSASAGIAGLALSSAATMTPLTAIAGPVILFTAISEDMKADENLEKAKVMYAEAEAASEKMKISENLCWAIFDRAEMFYDLLVDLNEMFSVCSSLLDGVISKKEGGTFQQKLSSQDFTEEDLKLIAVTRALAGAVKAVIDTPILSNDGSVSYESEKSYFKTVEKMHDLSLAVEGVEIDYGCEKIKARKVKRKYRAFNEK